VQSTAEIFHIRIKNELTEGGLPEGFQIEIQEQPATFTTGTYVLRIDNLTQTTQTLQFTGATLEVISMAQEDGTQHVIAAGNVGPTDTVSVIQRKSPHAYTTTQALLHIHDADNLEFQSAILVRDLKTQF
jgi:VCBS repeat-containing protein